VTHTEVHQFPCNSPNWIAFQNAVIWAWSKNGAPKVLVAITLHDTFESFSIWVILSCALAEAAPLTGGLRFDLSGGAPQRNKTETPLAAPPFLRAQTTPGRIDTPAGTGANWCDKSQGRMK
jgi:hypothetical protein